MLLISLAGFCFFYLIPFLLSFFYSVVDNPVNGKFCGLQNYKALFQNIYFLRGLKNTAWGNCYMEAGRADHIYFYWLEWRFYWFWLPGGVHHNGCGGVSEVYWNIWRFAAGDAVFLPDRGWNGKGYSGEADCIRAVCLFGRIVFWRIWNFKPIKLIHVRISGKKPVSWEKSKFFLALHI